MPNTREKLIELLQECMCDYVSAVSNEWWTTYEIEYEKLADHLIANGVTVQEWIPVTERLPTEEDADDDGFVFAYTTENKKIIARWTDVRRFNEFVTHWMPLPEPPKGE